MQLALGVKRKPSRGKRVCAGLEGLSRGRGGGCWRRWWLGPRGWRQCGVSLANINCIFRFCYLGFSAMRSTRALRVKINPSSPSCMLSGYFIPSTRKKTRTPGYPCGCHLRIVYLMWLMQFMLKEQLSDVWEEMASMPSSVVLPSLGFLHGIFSLI